MHLNCLPVVRTAHSVVVHIDLTAGAAPVQRARAASTFAYTDVIINDEHACTCVGLIVAAADCAILWFCVRIACRRCVPSSAAAPTTAVVFSGRSAVGRSVGWPGSRSIITFTVSV